MEQGGLNGLYSLPRTKESIIMIKRLMAELLFRLAPRRAQAVE